ncbi:MAG: RHS repeat domain-containing protein, partial [Candidatus Binatia bacterium]
IRWTFNDHLGTPVLQTDATGAVVWRLEQEPYGSEFAFRAGSALPQPLRFPGQERGLDSSRSYNVFRWYRGGWGRYTQADPIELQGGFNLFAYGEQNPVMFMDPLGLAAELVCKVIAPKGMPIPFLFHCRVRAICVDDCEVLDDTFGMEAGNPYWMPQWPTPKGLDNYYIRQPISHAGMSDCDFYKCLRAHNKLFGNGYGDKQGNKYVPPYSAQGPNSNSYAAKLLDMCGGQTDFPWGAWGSKDTY